MVLRVWNLYLGHVESMLGEYQKGYEQMQEGMELNDKLGIAVLLSAMLEFLFLVAM